MKKVVLMTILTVVAVTLLATNFTMSGDLRTRLSMYKEVGADEGVNFIDSRGQLTFDAEIEKDLNFVYTLRSGDLVWGEPGQGYWSNQVNVKTHHMYLKWKCPFTAMDAKVGLQAWYDHKSLVLDDDIAAIMVTKNDVMPNMNLQLGYLSFNESVNGLNSRDSDGFLINLDHKLNDDMAWGLNTIIKRDKTVADDALLDLWFMPFFTFGMDALSADAMFALSYGSYAKQAPGGKDVSNMGMALALDASYDMKEMGVPGINFLYASGDDGTDPESTTQFNTISNYYMNGLEYFGTGAHDGVNGGWFDANNGGKGLMSVVFKYSYPVNEKLEAKFAAGMLNSIEESSNGETAMGTEIDLGMNYKMFEKYTVKLVGAFVMPGEYFGPDPDSVYELSSVLSVEF